MRQTFTDWEWIVVDDGSTDGTAESVRQIDDGRVRLFSYRQNKGRGYARNMAVKESRGDWIVIWDVDDIHFPERLAIIEQAKIRNYDYFCSYAVVVSNNMEIKGTRGFFEPSGCLPRTFVHPTLALKKEVAQAVGYTITRGVGGIGEDARVLWMLSLKYRGLWYEDALTVYQEDREINLKKALDCNIGHWRTIKQLRREGIIAFDIKYFLSSVKYYIKIFILAVLQAKPELYQNLVSLRDYGQLNDGWRLSQNKIDFIKYYQMSIKK